MKLSDYPCESLTFSGVGATGTSPADAVRALAEALNAWVAAHPGRRILQITTAAMTTRDGDGLTALIIHTAGPELAGELAEQVALAIGDAMEESTPAELRDPLRQRSAR